MIHNRVNHLKVDCQVKLQADLSAAAFKNKLTNELCLWHALRAIDQPNGKGYLAFEIARDRLVNDFNYSPTTLNRLLSRSKGKVLDITPGKRGSTIKIYGLYQLVRYLGITQLSQRHWHETPVSQFTSVAKRHGQLYASILHPAGIKGNPISRETITRLTGLSVKQQRRYDIIAGIKRVPTYAVQRAADPLGGAGFIPMKQIIFTRAKGERAINKRLGNIYYTRQTAGSKGMLGKVRAVKSESLVSGEAHHLIKSYFLSFKQLLRAITRRTRTAKWGYYLVPVRKRLIKGGRLEWCLIQC